MARRVLLVAVVLVLAATLAVPAWAARPTKASISADGINPHATFGQNVEFTVTSSAERPWVYASCYQDGEWVYGEWHGLFDGYYTDPIFTLGPTQLWTGGDAECVAEVGYVARNGRFRVQADTTFSVID